MSWSVRVVAVLALILCVCCKMVDLDCALNDPPHCQTLFESGDNTFGHLTACDQALPPPQVVILVLRQVPPPDLLPRTAPRRERQPDRPAWLAAPTLKRPPPRVA